MLVEDLDSSCMRFESRAMFKHLNDAIEKLKRFLEKFGVTDFSGPSVVLLELLKNAANHGCNGNNETKVSAEVKHIRDKEFKIVVEDGGKGFEYGRLNLKLPEDPRRIRMRGYKLINALSNRLEFNERGNRITAYISAS